MRVSQPPKTKRDAAKNANIIALFSLIVAAISLAATGVFSWLNYQEAQQADRSATLAQQATALTRYADKVSYWLVSSGDSEQIEVSNLSDQTIENVIVMASSLSAEPSVPDGDFGFVQLSDIPPCQIMTADALDAARISMVKYHGSVTAPGAYNPFFPAPPKPLSTAQAKREMLAFEHRNGFKVELDFLIFTDANGRLWARDDQGRLIDSSTLSTDLGQLLLLELPNVGINSVSYFRNASAGCSLDTAACLYSSRHLRSRSSYVVIPLAAISSSAIIQMPSELAGGGRI